MKKILFILLCTVSMYGQVSTGQEQEFDYGIKNNATQTVTTPTYLGTVGADGTYGKMNRNNVIEYLEFASAVNLPVTGEQGKLYLTKDNNKIYRWNGTFYQELASSDLNYQSIIDALTFTPENVANKATTLTASSTLYPTNNAVIVALATKEDKVNKVTSIGSPANDTNYPSELAVKTYADNLVVGMLNDRGTWDASVNVFPTTGGSGVGGVIRKGDMWYISVAGTLGTKSVNVGDSFRALVNAPSQVAANWSILEANIGYVPANDSNVVHLAGAETITGDKTFSPTLNAVGNGQTLIGLDISPTFNTGAFISTITSPLRVTGGTTTDSFLGLFLQKGITPSVSKILPTSGKMVSVQGAGGAYYMGNDVTNNIEFVMGSSSAGAAFTGSITNHPLELRTENITKLKIFNVTGNTVFQNGGTFTDDGINRVQVTGTISSGTTALGNTPPTANNQLTRKDYVDTGLALKANLASPSLTGTPTAPTATAGTNTTQIANAAFVTSAISTADSGNVKLTGNQTVGGTKTFIDMRPSSGIIFPHLTEGIAVGAGAGSTGIAFDANSLNIAISGTSTGSLDFSLISGLSKTWSFPNTTGTFALTNNPTPLTATSFIKSSTPATNILLAGGGDIAQNTAFNKNFGTTAGTVVEGGTLGSNAYTSSAYQPLLTNPITGTGTSNYLPKFTGTGTIGNSSIVDNGSYIGLNGNVNIGKDNTGVFYNALGAFGHTFYSQAGANRLVDILNNGNVGIGTATPSTKLDVAGTFNATGAATFASTVTATGFFQSSDRRLKTILKRDGDVAYFKWKDGRDDKKHIGYIAQEVRKTNPDQVQKGEDGMLSVNYVEILVEKIRVLEKRIEQLEKSK